VRHKKSLRFLWFLRRVRKKARPMNRTSHWWSLPESKRFSLLKSRRWLLCVHIMRVKYRVAVTRVARIEKRGRRCATSTTLLVRWRAMMFPDNHAGRSLARSLDQGPTCRTRTYMNSSVVTGGPRSTANTHWTLKDVLLSTSINRKKQKEIVALRHYAADSNRLFTGNFQILIVLLTRL